MPGRKQPRPAESNRESGLFRHDRVRGSIGCDAIRQKHSRQLPPRLARCQTIATVRKAASSGCVGWPETLAEKVRSAPPRIRNPSRPGRCESMPAGSAQRPGNPPKQLYEWCRVTYSCDVPGRCQLYLRSCMQDQSVRSPALCRAPHSAKPRRRIPHSRRPEDRR